MKITLRKADAIQREIRAQLNDLATLPQVEINAFDDPVGQVDAAAVKWVGDRAAVKVLRGVLYTIRKSVGAANQATGIDATLADMAHVDDELADLKKILAAEPRPSPEVLQGTATRLAQPVESRPYGRIEVISTATVGILEEDQRAALEGELVELRRRKRALQDKLLELNFRNEIELSEDDAGCLERHGIL